MNEISTPNHTLNFLDQLCQCCNKSGTLNFQDMTTDKLKQLESCCESTVDETINNIDAIGELLFWVGQLNEPPIECTGQVGLLLQSLSDLLNKANFIKDEAVYHLRKSEALKS